MKSKRIASATPTVVQSAAPELKSLRYKALDTLISHKLLVTIISTVLVVKQVIDQNTWMMVTLSLSGMRTANELLALHKKRGVE